ncbi:spermatogenesis associated 6-like protein isoform 2-T6 [Alca torda]
MPLKVVVELLVQAVRPLQSGAAGVTCPGVFLPEKHDVFLSVCILGQRKKTECLPPVFPLLFYEKMCFEKVFESAIDPAAVTEMLESNVTRFALTQLVSSEGDDLAFYEENTRDFLFPERKLTPAYPGVDRELLMKTAPPFPGIAPKIEFSTRTTITELPLQHRRKNYGRNRTRNQRSASPKQKNQSLTQCKTSLKRDKSYGRHTRSLKSQTPPLNTRDRFCELCRENHQQPSRLHLESPERKSENETRPPFVVRHVDSSKLFIEVTSPLRYRKVKQSKRSAKHSLKSHEKRVSSFDNCEVSNTSVKMIKQPSEQTTSEHDSSSLGRGGPVSYLHYPPSQRDSAFHRTASSAASQHLESPSPVGSPSAFQNRELLRMKLMTSLKERLSL